MLVYLGEGVGGGGGEGREDQVRALETTQCVG